jgi:hypothetical protein
LRFLECFDGTLVFRFFSVEVLMKRFLPLLILLVFTPKAHALIAVGINWNAVFVQEYWRNGQPYYDIANITAKPLDISTSDGGKWKVKPGRIIHGEAKIGRPNTYIRFLTQNGSLGTLPAPLAPPQVVKEKYVTYEGLNGSGGRYSDLYVQQTEHTFPGGGFIEVELVVPANRGLINFPKAGANKYPLKEAFIAEAKCDSLKVTDNGKEIVIDANQPLKNQNVHTVRLRFRAPNVQKRSMVLINGWARQGQGGHGITRGVIVVPGAAPEAADEGKK